MWKIAQRLDHFLHEKLTWKTFIQVILGITLLLFFWYIVLHLARGQVFPVWTGFGSDPASAPAGASKTLWDWLELLLAPILILIVAAWSVRSLQNTLESLTIQRNQHESLLAEENRQVGLQGSAENQREAVLREYLDKMEVYLLAGNRSTGRTPEEGLARQVARLRTITTVRRLDRERANAVFQFLRDAGLAQTLLVGAELQNANLEGANLSQIHLRKADLSWSNLNRAFLRESDLTQAHLYDADLVRALLNNALLRAADLCMADLSEANLTHADLRDANLNRANLNRAIMHDADLSGADLTGADLINADLTRANLSGAKVSASQLNSAHSLFHAIMPDGREYEEGESVSPADVDTGDWRKKRAAIAAREASRRAANPARTNVWRDPQDGQTQAISQEPPDPDGHKTARVAKSPRKVTPKT